MCRFVFIRWLFKIYSCLVWVCVGMCVFCLGLLRVGVVVIVCFIWGGGWFVLMGSFFWCVLGCRLKCSCRSGSCCLMVGCGLVL